MLVPFGARKAFFGANPICFGFPTDGIPMVLDMATTGVAWGKVALAAVEGRPFPTLGRWMPLGIPRPIRGRWLACIRLLAIKGVAWRW